MSALRGRWRHLPPLTVALLAATLPMSPVATALSGPPHAPSARTISAGSGVQRTIALTFDDGWDADRCLAIAHTLDRYAVPGTFFPNGVYVAQDPVAWRSIGNRFPIGNHTFHHTDLRTLDAPGITRELERNRRVIEGVTGRPMVPLLRPPYGASNARVARVAGSLGYTRLVLWDTSDADTAPHVTPRGAARAALRGGPGSIVLLHCGPEVTPRILPIVIERYACAGYRFATVEELLAGSTGHRARVDCPPLALPAPTRTHGPTDTVPTDPEPTPTARPTHRPLAPTPSPSSLPSPSAVPSSSAVPSLPPRRPVGSVAVTVGSWLASLADVLRRAVADTVAPPNSPDSAP